MVVLRSEMTLFPFLGAEHPFYAPIQDLKNQLIATPLYQDMRRKLDAGEEARLRISMKAHALNSIWKLKGFYLSLQFREKSSSPQFHASTFFCSAKKRSIDSFEFPQDPYLTTVATYFNDRQPQKNGDETGVDVLRYYPGKRLTFRTTVPSEKAIPVIGKFVRSLNVAETYNKLVQIFRVVGRSTCTFSVAAPKGIEVNGGFFLQEEMRGKALAGLINKENFRTLLQALGVIHRDLQRLTVPGLPLLDFAAFLRKLTVGIDWISFCRPRAESFFAEVKELLVNHVPRVDPRQYTFCHGDFSSLQVLKDHDNFSIIDFDDCVLGDPYWEIAKLIAFIKYDVPLFRDWFIRPEEKTELIEEACQVYLKGYQGTAQQALNQKRLLWYRICFEIDYLARLFKRDLFHPLAFDRTVKVIRELCEHFRLENEEDF